MAYDIKKDDSEYKEEYGFIVDPAELKCCPLCGADDLHIDRINIDMPEQIVLKEIEVKRLSLKPGDVLAVKLDSTMLNNQSNQDLYNMMKELLPSDVGIIFYTQDVDFTIMNHEYMDDGLGNYYSTKCSECGG